MHTLYLCYFGLREPLVQTQVLPYLRELARGGLCVSLLTFEPEMEARWGEDEAEAMGARLLAEGIEWHRLAYHKRPSLPATLYDIAAGAWHAARLAREEGIDVFHGRGHVAAAMGALASGISGSRLIFDIRGFMPEEYVDAGVWPSGGLLYRGMKWVERRLMRSADGFVVLTERARQILFPRCADEDEEGRPIEVIPCCIDGRRFAAAQACDRAAMRHELGMAGRRVITYVGSFGGWYLTDEMIAFFATARRQDDSTFALILTQSNAGEIARRLSASGFGSADFLVKRVEPSEVPKLLMAADAALSFIKRCYSKQSSSPTKIAEYLACGLPVLSNDGIGDLDALIEGERVGVLVREFAENEYLRVLLELDRLKSNDDLGERCIRVAQAKFDLATVGGVGYRRLYERLAGRDVVGERDDAWVATVAKGETR